MSLQRVSDAEDLQACINIGAWAACNGGKVTVGRGDKHLRLDIKDAPRQLSRDHCTLRLDGRDLILHDLGSTNGTFYTLPTSEENVLRAPAKEDVCLPPGSTLYFGGSMVKMLDQRDGTVSHSPNQIVYLYLPPTVAAPACTLSGSDEAKRLRQEAGSGGGGSSWTELRRQQHEQCMDGHLESNGGMQREPGIVQHQQQQQQQQQQQRPQPEPRPLPPSQPPPLPQQQQLQTGPGGSGAREEVDLTCEEDPPRDKGPQHSPVLQQQQQQFKQQQQCQQQQPQQQQLVQPWLGSPLAAAAQERDGNNRQHDIERQGGALAERPLLLESQDSGSISVGSRPYHVMHAPRPQQQQGQQLPQRPEHAGPSCQLPSGTAVQPAAAGARRRRSTSPDARLGAKGATAEEPRGRSSKRRATAEAVAAAGTDSGMHTPPPAAAAVPDAAPGPSAVQATAAAGHEAAARDAQWPRVPSPNDDELAAEATCSVCRELFVSPFSLACGHSFCGACLQNWLLRKAECPNCRGPVRAPPLPNRAMGSIANLLAGRATGASQGSRQERVEQWRAVEDVVRSEWATMFPVGGAAAAPEGAVDGASRSAAGGAGAAAAGRQQAHQAPQQRRWQMQRPAQGALDISRLFGTIAGRGRGSVAGGTSSTAGRGRGRSSAGSASGGGSSGRRRQGFQIPLDALYPPR